MKLFENKKSPPKRAVMLALSVVIRICRFC